MEGKRKKKGRRERGASSVERVGFFFWEVGGERKKNGREKEKRREGKREGKGGGGKLGFWGRK